LLKCSKTNLEGKTLVWVTTMIFTCKGEPFKAAASTISIPTLHLLLYIFLFSYPIFFPPFSYFSFLNFVIYVDGSSNNNSNYFSTLRAPLITN